ncbi:hypothetical protein BU14_0267s0006 [Porphyra umbilicalis]|uniref:Uncharacterized protein n=1 Tax=Porphyra umbilicalis TaxID=2786 RepID=A0A1X6P202_PORUM|nr:hypothetical protein BU14_0267s0006 [Porphyra umbilicalis]|eukprot:OSX74805.1 hypothetical protein BU14_0267s0006 [Porphyra umbilicalis]
MNMVFSRNMCPLRVHGNVTGEFQNWNSPVLGSSAAVGYCVASQSES